MRLGRVIPFLLAAALTPAPAGARSSFHDLPVQEAVDSELGKTRLLDVPFYMAGQSHPGVARDLGTFTSNRRTNAFLKSDEDACRVAFLSAIIALQERVRREGGDAVVDVKSITKHRDLESASQYRCVAGSVVANVALSGRVVKLAR